MGEATFPIGCELVPARAWLFVSEGEYSDATTEIYEIDGADAQNWREYLEAGAGSFIAITPIGISGKHTEPQRSEESTVGDGFSRGDARREHSAEFVAWLRAVPLAALDAVVAGLVERRVSSWPLASSRCRREMLARYIEAEPGQKLLPIDAADVARFGLLPEPPHG